MFHRHLKTFHQGRPRDEKQLKLASCELITGPQWKVCRFAAQTTLWCFTILRVHRGTYCLYCSMVRALSTQRYCSIYKKSTTLSQLSDKTSKAMKEIKT